jgi:PAS domain S-box-containing protein
MIGIETERGMLLNGLLAAMRLSSQPMVVSDPYQADNPVIAANRGFQNLTHYTEKDVTGRNCRFLQGPGTDKRAVKQLGECLRGGDGCVQFLVNYRRDGSQFYNLLFISPVHGHDGHLHFFFASQHDLCSWPPIGLAEFPLGPAHMPAGQAAEFRLLLLDIAHEVTLASAASALPHRIRALEAALAAAREIALLATRLQPGKIQT